MFVCAHMHASAVFEAEKAYCIHVCVCSSRCVTPVCVTVCQCALHPVYLGSARAYRLRLSRRHQHQYQQQQLLLQWKHQRQLLASSFFASSSLLLFFLLSSSSLVVFASLSSARECKAVFVCRLLAFSLSSLSVA